MTGPEKGYPAAAEGSGGRRGEFYALDRRVYWNMLYRAWEMHPLFCVRRIWFCVRGPPVSFISKTRNGGHRNVRMDQNQSKRFL